LLDPTGVKVTHHKTQKAASCILHVHAHITMAPSEAFILHELLKQWPTMRSSFERLRDHDILCRLLKHENTKVHWSVGIFSMVFPNKISYSFAVVAPEVMLGINQLYIIAPPTFAEKFHKPWKF